MLLNIILRTLAVLAVVGALTAVTNELVNRGDAGSRFGGEAHEREHREHHEREFDPNSFTNTYPALGVAAGLAPTVIKLTLIGVVVVQGRTRLLSRTKRRRAG